MWSWPSCSPVAPLPGHPGSVPLNLNCQGWFRGNDDGLSSGQYDVLDINGSAVFTGGNIEFDFINNGFNPPAGDCWDFPSSFAIRLRRILAAISLSVSTVLPNCTVRAGFAGSKVCSFKGSPFGEPLHLGRYHDFTTRPRSNYGSTSNRISAKLKPADEGEAEPPQCHRLFSG